MNAIQPELANQLLSSLLESAEPELTLLNHPDYRALLSESGKHQQVDWAAHMSPSLAPYSLLGMQLATLHGGNLLSPELYPALKQAESDSLNWLCKQFHQPYAHFTHGGSYANLEALWKARDSSSSGRSYVYASDSSHYSIIKACQILGLELTLLPTNREGQIDIPSLQAACEKQAPLAIVMNMGSSATGSIDNLEAGIKLGQKFSSWVHIDAAWGGALMCIADKATAFACLQHAQSISFDPHKSLFQPKPSSVLLYQHVNTSVSHQTDYLETPPTQMLPGSYGGELFIPLWLNLLLLGEAWFAKQIELRLQEAALFANQLRQWGWPVIHSETGIVCFQVPDELDMSEWIEKGLFSKVRLGSKDYFRAVFANNQTTAENLFKVLHPAL